LNLEHSNVTLRTGEALRELEMAMPLYEYSCPSCGHQFEELVRAADADKVACPKCKSPKASRKFSTFGVSMAPTRSGGSSGPGGSCPGCPGAAGGSCPYKS
jgi:putative FmdB family regulatory protein